MCIKVQVACYICIDPYQTKTDEHCYFNSKMKLQTRIYGVSELDVNDSLDIAWLLLSTILSCINGKTISDISHHTINTTPTFNFLILHENI